MTKLARENMPQNMHHVLVYADPPMLWAAPNTHAYALLPVIRPSSRRVSASGSWANARRTRSGVSTSRATGTSTSSSRLRRSTALIKSGCSCGPCSLHRCGDLGGLLVVVWNATRDVPLVRDIVSVIFGIDKSLCCTL
jgi:hypothetical protein